MSFINNLYQQTVADNEKNLRFWEDYLKNLRALDFSVYADKLKVPTLVPIGSRVFFRGELKHTNEVTVALGADYFVKCSLAQAEVLRHHRMKDAESKLESFRKEREYIENQLSFTKQNLFEKEGHEIVEEYTEEEDKAWREKHRENVRKSKKQQTKEEEKQKEEITDEELWNRLEELELEEELENELLDNYNAIGDKRKENTFLDNEEKVLMNTYKQEQLKNHSSEDKVAQNKETVIDETKNSLKDNQVPEGNENKHSKLELLQQVLDKQNQLENKLLELKNRDREPSKTQKDLMSRLDEIEQLEELEDEMERLDDVLETENIETDDDDEIDEKTTPTKLKRSISFADEVEDASKTLEIAFKHSEVEPSNEPYSKEKGISKPSDIYEAYSHLFDSKPASILKKSNYECSCDEEAFPRKVKINSTPDNPEIEVYPVKETIVVKDVRENSSNLSKIDTDVRPTSLFKQRRMQKSQKQNKSK